MRLLRRLRDRFQPAAAQGPRGVGVDVEDVARWREPRRLTDLFTPDERARAERSRDPAPHYAGWWAAREAAVKALRAEGIGVRQVSVVHDDEGRPRLVIDGRPELAARCDLSISHSATTAVAVVVRR